MIKTGIYGLLRVADASSARRRPWWGWTLVGIGAVSGVLGVLFALAQHDLKRLLAYHSVENIGIIALGLGLGLLGHQPRHRRRWPCSGFAGGAAARASTTRSSRACSSSAPAPSLHATGTREIDRLGGLLKRMPWTGATFLVGAAAISRPAAAERLRERVPDLPRRVRRRSATRGRAAARRRRSS